MSGKILFGVLSVVISSVVCSSLITAEIITADQSASKESPDYLKAALDQSIEHPVLIPKIEYTKADIKCLANNIYWEARGESQVGQMAVGAVTINRVQDSKKPTTICAVVKKKRQFSWYKPGKSYKIADKKAFMIATNIAKMLLNHKNMLPDITKGANYYHASHIKPVWAKHMTKVGSIDNHIFYVGVYG